MVDQKMTEEEQVQHAENKRKRKLWVIRNDEMKRHRARSRHRRKMRGNPRG